MDHTPPPFFKRGPAPLVRLFFFASLSLALLVVDARFRYVDGLRSWLALAAYPLQRAATWPIDLAMGGGGYFSTQANLVEENRQLRERALNNAQDAQRFQAAQAEANELRRSIGASEKLPVPASTAAPGWGQRKSCRGRRAPPGCFISDAIHMRTSFSSTAARSRACGQAVRS